MSVDEAEDLFRRTVESHVGPKDGLSAARVPFRVVQLCDDANALADGLRELAPYARHPRDALLLAAAISKVAIAAIGPDLWGGFFTDKA